MFPAFAFFLQETMLLSENSDVKNNLVDPRRKKEVNHDPGH